MLAEIDEPYCCLCAEPTPNDQLITINEIIDIKSENAVLMDWINIDISPTNPLPAAICVSCFDLLERTWVYLNNVRPNERINEKLLSENTKADYHDYLLQTGRLENWEDFETKVEVKDEAADLAMTDRSTTLGNNSAIKVKTEDLSHNTVLKEISDCNSTDSDLPLRKISKKKRKSSRKLNSIDVVDCHVTNTQTWQDYLCRCGTCDAQCKNIASLQKHSLEKHSCCCVFKCIICQKVFSSHKSFVKHARIHNKNLRQCCEFCNACFETGLSLRNHVDNAHANIYLTTCHNCGTVFESPELLGDHVSRKSKFRKKRTLKSKSGTCLKCDQCGRVFKTLSNLHQHKLVHMPRSRKFSCHICSKTFFTKGTLGTHMVTHEATKPFKCDFCPMAFRARCNLQSHITMHSGVKPFVCKTCGKSFRVQRHLKSHSIIHTDLMPYSCEYCNKTFRFKSRLNLHLRQHTGAKPYKCVHCDKDFINGSNYKKHMIRRHKMDTSTRLSMNVVVHKNNGAGKT